MGKVRSCKIWLRDSITFQFQCYSQIQALFASPDEFSKFKKKKTKSKKEIEVEGSEKPPKCFIFRRGSVGQSIKDLVKDMRLVMSPNTAMNLQEKSNNSMKDFLDVSGQLGISHFMAFSSSEFGSYLRLLRTPQGPSLTFKLVSYSLMADIHKLQSKPKSVSASDWQCSPILVLNNFSSPENHIKMMASAFQNAFPSLNVQLMKLKDAKRVVLIHYDKETDVIDLRHYLITTSQLGVKKSIKRVLQRKATNMSSSKDISDFVLSGQDATESDAEDLVNTDSHIDLPQNFVTPAKGFKPKKNHALLLQKKKDRRERREAEKQRRLDRLKVVSNSSENPNEHDVSDKDEAMDVDKPKVESGSENEKERAYHDDSASEEERDSESEDKMDEEDNEDEVVDEEGEENDQVSIGSQSDATTATTSSLASQLVKSAIRLYEIGPRIEMKLMKIQAGFGEGLVLHHSLISKTAEEISEQEKQRQRAKALKLKRRKEQELMVQKKQQEKENQRMSQKKIVKPTDDDEADAENSDHEDYNYERAPEEVLEQPDDVEWYRKEVGEEPTEEEIKELRASQPIMPGERKKFNPHWAHKKRSSSEITPKIPSKTVHTKTPSKRSADGKTTIHKNPKFSGPPLKRRKMKE